MTKQDDIKKLIRKHHRRLQLLKEKQASFGSLHTPVHILTDIEDTEAGLEQLQIELKETENDTSDLDQRVEQQRRRIADGLDELRHQATVAPAIERRQLRVVGRPPLGTVEHFKNRVREQEKIGRLLAEPTTRLVSVIGHGGMGKTALAGKVLRDLEQHRWPHTNDDIPLDGIVYLSARTAGISLERLFLDCARLLGGEQAKVVNAVWTNPKLDTVDKVTRLLEALQEGRYVILLDNMEDLLDERGQLTDENLQLFFDQSLTAAHGTRLLVTSRLAMAFRRELMRFDRQVNLLDGLPEADGIALLRELDPNSDYGLQDAPDEELARAVELVHGVPRALEVMAGILANDPFATLAEVLEQFYEQEDVVQALIEENYKRLDGNARRVIEALAVFKRPVPPLAVDYLLEPFAPGLDVPNILRRLTRTNIVSIDRATKTVTLHPIDQDFAYSQLPEEGSGEPTCTRQALERRAAEYYVQLRIPEETWKTIDDLEPQLAEFEHRIRAGDYDGACMVLNTIDFNCLFLWGHFTQLIELRGKLLGHLTDFRLQAINLGSLGRAYYPVGQVRRAIKFYEEALPIARSLNDFHQESELLSSLGRAYRKQGDFDQSMKLHKQALSIARKIKDREAEGSQLGYLGRTYRDLGRGEQAIKLYKEALAIAREIGHRRWEGIWLGHLGIVYTYEWHLEQAIELFKEGLTIAREIGNLWEVEYNLGHLGNAYRTLGQLERAIDFHNKALSIARKIGDRQGEGVQLGNIARVFYSLGQLDQAIKFHKQDLRIAREAGNPFTEAIILHKLGNAHSNLGLHEQAIELQKQALAITERIADQRGQSYSLLGLGKALLIKTELSEAQQCCERSLALDMLTTGYAAATTLGIVLLNQSNPTAGKAFTEAINRCRTILGKTTNLYELRYTLATALVGQATCSPHWLEANKRPELLTPALTEYQRALKICDAPGVVKDAIRDLELIQAAGIEGLEPVFELLEGVLEEDGN